MESPRFFVDRSLGRVRVPRLLRERGWSVLTLAEHYGIPQDESIPDVEWLHLAGLNNWAVLMKDAKIRYRDAERAALVAGGVRAFCLTGGNLTADEMAERFIVRREEIWLQALVPGPALFAVSKNDVRPVDL